MKCNECGAWTEVAETRQVDGGHTMKRMRRCANGHRFPTFEVLPPIYRRDRRFVTATLRSVADRLTLWARYLHLARRAREVGVNEAARLCDTSRASVQRAIRATQPKVATTSVSASTSMDRVSSGGPISDVSLVSGSNTSDSD